MPGWSSLIRNYPDKPCTPRKQTVARAEIALPEEFGEENQNSGIEEANLHVRPKINNRKCAGRERAIRDRLR